MKVSNFCIILFIMCCCASSKAQLNGIDSVRNEIKRIKNTNGFTPENQNYIDLLLKLSDGLKYSKTDTLKILAERTMVLSKKINYDKGLIESQFVLGMYQFYAGNTEKANLYFEQTLEQSKTLGYLELAIRALNGLALTNNVKDDYGGVYLCLTKALELAKQINHEKWILILNVNLGTLFSLLKDYDEAQLYYQACLELSNDNTPKVTKGLLHANLGYLYLQQEKSNKALEYLDKAISFVDNENGKTFLTFAKLTKGEVYSFTGEFEKAKANFDYVKNMYETLTDVKGEADLYYAYGFSYLKQGKYQDAKEHINTALNKYKLLGLKVGIEKCYRSLYVINKETGLINESLTNFELARTFADSISEEYQKRDLSILKAKMSFEKSKQKLMEETRSEVAKQKNYIQWVTAGLIGLLLISVFIFRSNETKKRLNEELAVKAKTLSNKKEELDKINQNQDKLFSIVGKDLRAPILSLKQLLGTALDKDAEIKNFYTYGPQLKDDVDHIHFTLDNLLNWGLSQMKGDVNKPIEIAVKKELLGIMNFFTEALVSKEIIIDLNVRNDLYIRADLHHFNIIFKNLISNTIKFTPNKGTIKIDSYFQNDTVFITVKDTGIGMNKETLIKIFETKEHHTTPGTNREPGTGLGLILCLELIEKNNATIAVKSEVGSGTVISVGFLKSYA